MVDCHEVTSRKSFQVQRVPLPWMILRRESRLMRRSTSPFRCQLWGRNGKEMGGEGANMSLLRIAEELGISIHSQTMGLSGRWAGLNSKVCKAWIVVILDQTIPFFGVPNDLTHQMEFTQESELDLLQNRQSSVAMPVGSVQMLGLVKI